MFSLFQQFFFYKQIENINFYFIGASGDENLKKNYLAWPNQWRGLYFAAMNIPDSVFNDTKVT